MGKIKGWSGSHGFRVSRENENEMAVE